MDVEHGEIPRHENQAGEECQNAGSREAFDDESSKIDVSGSSNLSQVGNASIDEYHQSLHSFTIILP